ncbi:unnamed protein product [Pleuronectes platessa]|uniref:Uncharacterized protein n=1 Tax=Pleuronectes platessa TaxID=8262 RepID=A0A9N7YHK4_PLEPL|nr:unnamed protein product [Pleuronectes platessa]
MRLFSPSAVAPCKVSCMLRIFFANDSGHTHRPRGSAPRPTHTLRVKASGDGEGSEHRARERTLAHSDSLRPPLTLAVLLLLSPAAYWASVPAKSIFIHPVDYGTGWQGCPRGAEAKKRSMQVDAPQPEPGKQCSAFEGSIITRGGLAIWHTGHLPAQQQQVRRETRGGLDNDERVEADMVDHLTCESLRSCFPDTGNRSKFCMRSQRDPQTLNGMTGCVRVQPEAPLAARRREKKTDSIMTFSSFRHGSQEEESVGVRITAGQRRQSESSADEGWRGPGRYFQTPAAASHLSPRSDHLSQAPESLVPGSWIISSGSEFDGAAVRVLLTPEEEEEWRLGNEGLGVTLQDL